MFSSGVGWELGYADNIRLNEMGVLRLLSIIIVH